MFRINLLIIIGLITLLAVTAFSIDPVTKPKTTPQTVDSLNKINVKQTPADTSKNIQNTPPANAQGNLQIDTSINTAPQQTNIPADTVKEIDSTLIDTVSENTMTNTKLFIYILLSVLGLALFFYIFVITLFKTFHKKKSTRQSLLLSWNLFFIVTIIWILIIWGLVAGFWMNASFMIVVIFLFIISLIMTIIAIKSK